MSRKVFPADFPTRLWITGIPIVTAQQVEQDMADVIYWECHRPMTREHRIKRDEAFVRLRQSHWHLKRYLEEGGHMNKSWLDRFKNWVCKCFGHRVERDEYGTDTCDRCNRLLSTHYSRSRP